jgi:hypothetical protein
MMFTPSNTSLLNHLIERNCAGRGVWKGLLAMVGSILEIGGLQTAVYFFAVEELFTQVQSGKQVL